MAVAALLVISMAGVTAYLVRRAKDVEETALQLRVRKVMLAFPSLLHASWHGAVTWSPQDSLLYSSHEWKEYEQRFWDLYNGRLGAIEDAPIKAIMIAEGNALRSLAQTHQQSCRISPEFFEGAALLFSHCAKRAVDCTWPLHHAYQDRVYVRPPGEVSFDCNQSGFNQLANIQNVSGSCPVEVSTPPQDFICNSQTHHLDWRGAQSAPRPEQ